LILGAKRSFLLALPYLIGALLLVALPLLLALALSFFSYDGLSAPTWAGLNNFREALQEPLFPIAIVNSLTYVYLAVPLRLLAALGLALLFNRRRSGIGFYRAAVYLPTIIPEVAYALLWLWIFNPLYGPLNQLLRMLGLPAPAWLVNPHTALPALVIMSLFTIGEAFVILLAAQRSIPTETYEAAAVDGSNAWQSCWHLTLPLLKPWLILLLVRDIILSFQTTFTPAYIMTGGGPYYATYFFPLLIFEEAFDRLRFGIASAMMLLMFLTTLVLLLLLFGIFQGWGYEDNVTETEPPGGASFRPHHKRISFTHRTQKVFAIHTEERVNRKWRRRYLSLPFYVVATFVAIIFLLPLIWMAASSLRLPGLPPARGMEWLPHPLAWGNYPALFRLIPLGRYILNSLLVSGLAVILTIPFASAAGFGISQLEAKARRTLLLLSVGLLMVPLTALWLTRFVIFARIGWIDSYLPLLIPVIIGSSPFFVLLYYWAFRRLPAEYFEAARLEGIHPVGVMRRVALPLVRPTTATVAVLTFILYWNDFINPLLYLKSPRLYTLSIGLQQLQQLDSTNWPLLLAGSVIMILPVVVLFLFIQKYFFQEG
jgi:ABC-type sugar transport system permease subunit